MGGALILAEAPVHFIFSALTSVPVSLLQAPYQLVPFSLNAIKVVISEIASPFFDLSTHLFPFPFHNTGRCWRNSRKRRVLNVTLTDFQGSPTRQPDAHAVQQSRRVALPIANTLTAVLRTA